MMLTNKKSTSKSWIKVFALLPIVGAALVLNAETVNDYVYEETPTNTQPQAKVVKKGKKDAQIKMNGKTIEIKEEKTVETKAKEDPKRTDLEIIFSDKQEGPEPLLVIDGKVATIEQVKALDKKEIDNISVVKNEETLKVYAKHFEADTSNGIIFINTKEHVKNGKKEVVEVVVKSKKPEEVEEPFDKVEEMPEFPGGTPELMKFLQENVKYPEEAMKNGIQGRVLVQFIVEKDGSITELKVVKKANELLDGEALRVANAMPKWTPGKQKGEVVRVKFTLPITFRLQ